ncbi:MAG: tetratricopeptide repeat protein, partial [Myxococcota bacterium]
EAAVRAALGGAPDYLAARNNLGLILLKQGRTDDALHTFTRVLQAAPGNAAGLTNRALVYMNLGKTELALADLERAADIDPQRTADVLWVLGQANREMGHAEQAERIICKAAALGHREARARCTTAP